MWKQINHDQKDCSNKKSRHGITFNSCKWRGQQIWKHLYNATFEPSDMMWLSNKCYNKVSAICKTIRSSFPNHACTVKNHAEQQTARSLILHLSTSESLNFISTFNINKVNFLLSNCLLIVNVKCCKNTIIASNTNCYEISLWRWISFIAPKNVSCWKVLEQFYIIITMCIMYAHSKTLSHKKTTKK